MTNAPAPSHRREVRSDVVRPREDLAMVEIDGDGIVYDFGEERVHLLNPTAVFVWKLLDGETCLADLAEDISVAAGVDQRVVLDDLVRLVGDLEAEGLLEHGEGAPDRAAQAKHDRRPDMS